MAQLAVGGYAIQVDDVSLVGLRTGGGRALEIRGQWHATTDDYEPVLVLELSDGLLVTRCGSDGAPTDELLCVTSSQVGSVVAEERIWAMVLTSGSGPAVRLRFASLAELHQVMARVQNWTASASHPEVGSLENDVAGDPTTARAEGEERTEWEGQCSTRRAPGAVRARRRARGGTAGPAWDQLERRLASVETRLADLAVGTTASGGVVMSGVGVAEPADGRGRG